MSTMQERIREAHAVTLTCNAGSDQPFNCHSLACRTTAFRGAPRPELPAWTLALIEVFERAMSYPTPEQKLGSLEGGIEGLLIGAGVNVATLAGGVR